MDTKEKIKNKVAECFIIIFGVDAKYQKKAAEFLVDELQALIDSEVKRVEEETIEECILVAEKESDDAAYDDDSCESEDCHFSTDLGYRIVSELKAKLSSKEK